MLPPVSVRSLKLRDGQSGRRLREAIPTTRQHRALVRLVLVVRAGLDLIVLNQVNSQAISQANSQTGQVNLAGGSSMHRPKTEFSQRMT